jgi:hypothetical protein
MTLSVGEALCARQAAPDSNARVRSHRRVGHAALPRVSRAPHVAQRTDPDARRPMRLSFRSSYGGDGAAAAVCGRASPSNGVMSSLPRPSGAYSRRYSARTSKKYASPSGPKSTPSGPK